MNISGIQSIQIQQNSPLVRDKNASTAPTTFTTSDSSTMTRAAEGQLQGVLNNIDSIKQQLDAIAVYYPPFFPAGAPVRADWINKLNTAQDEIATVASKNGDRGISFTPQKLKENATDAEIVGAIQNLGHFRKQAARIIPAATDTKKPGAFVNIEVK